MKNLFILSCCLFLLAACGKEESEASLTFPRKFDFERNEQQEAIFRLLQTTGSTEINVPVDSSTIGALGIYVESEFQDVANTEEFESIEFLNDSMVTVSFNFASGLEFDSTFNYSSISTNEFKLSNLPDFPLFKYDPASEMLILRTNFILYTYYNTFKQADDYSALFTRNEYFDNWSALSEFIRADFDLMEGDTIGIVPLDYIFK